MIARKFDDMVGMEDRREMPLGITPNIRERTD